MEAVIDIHTGKQHKILIFKNN